MRFGSLFAGIGGFDLGLERAGMTCAWQVENNDYCTRVLEKHWPDVPRYRDVKEATGLPPVELICGGFPCQPFSHAGKQRSTSDDRYLWPQMLRIINEVRPTWVLGENVAGIIRLALDEVCASLEDSGYAVRTFAIPAVGVDAPHIRERVWILAHAPSSGGAGLSVGTAQAYAEPRIGGEDDPDPYGETGGQPWGASEAVSRPSAQQRPGRLRGGNWRSWQPEPPVGRVAHGIPRRVDRLRALGNAVVPQVVEVLGRAIMEAA